MNPPTEPPLLTPLHTCTQGPEIVPYLQQLVGGLGAVLGCSGPPVQELSLSALASVVAAAGKEFEPYLGEKGGVLCPSWANGSLCWIDQMSAGRVGG